MLSGHAVSVLSQPLLDEQRRALSYPKIARIQGAALEGLGDLLCEFVAMSMWIDPHHLARAKEPAAGDQHLWDLLHHDGRFRLVTGDRLLLANAPVSGGVGGIRVLTAREGDGTIASRESSAQLKPGLRALHQNGS